MQPNVNTKSVVRSNRLSDRLRKAMPNAIRIPYRAVNVSVCKLRYAILSLFCDALSRWGNKVGISGNFRGKLFWRAGRRDIVPLSHLYEYLKQERPVGHYYPDTPMWSSRSQTIINGLYPFLTQESSILEIGCNSGRNLNHLWRAGYKNVRGMEISAHAVSRLRLAYPQLADVSIDVGPAEVSIRKYGNRSVDVIFTMAVLEHLHPDCRFLFREIARVAWKYVLAIEPRRGKRSHMQYPWDMKAEFTVAGLTLVDTKPWSALWAGELTERNEWQDGMHEYEAFLFKCGEHRA